MSKTILHDGDDGVELIIRETKLKRSRKQAPPMISSRSPVHVVYGGAHLFKSTTPRKLGEIALRTFEEYIPSSTELGVIFGLGKDADVVFQRIKAKLLSEPVEDLRIDFEDGYGFRPDAEEDADAARAAGELAAASKSGTITPFSGFRVRSYTAETRGRAKRTLNIFLENLVRSINGKLPDNFVVTLPKVTDKKEVVAFCRDLKKIEKKVGLRADSIKIEIMIEHPLAIIDKRGNIALKGLVEAAEGRCVAAHFGAYDHTAALGIAAPHQDITHPACDFARQMMLLSLVPLGIRLSDSVTPQMPVPVHKGENLSAGQKAENAAAVTAGLRVHFANVTRSMSQGFFQGWDLHPNQMIARYAAVYAFFLDSIDQQGSRLRAFIDKATKATLTGNAFDDAATAMGIVNFFRQGLDCGAFLDSEIEKAAGMSAADLRKRSFIEILRRY